MNKLFKVTNLSLNNNDTKILKDINLEVNEGEILGIIGESGCGKSTLIRALCGMINEDEEISSGSILFEDKELVNLSAKEMRQIRGKDIGIVFQNPASTLNPVIKIGKQFIEAVNVHEKTKKKECMRRAAELMKRLNLDDAECILDSYTFELSGGMNQRIAIALAMIMNPKLLICDEPTSALDVTVASQVVKELIDLRNHMKTSMIIVTHSMGVVSNMADKVAVMYGGEIVEYGKCSDILDNPLHPYTKALISAVPEMNGELPKPIRGNMHSFASPVEGCTFAERCDLCNDDCRFKRPQVIEVMNNEHFVRCKYSNAGGNNN